VWHLEVGGDGVILTLLARSIILKILFLTLYDEQWADSRVRVYQYLPFLDDRGIGYKVIPIISKDLFRHGKLRYYLSAGLNALFKWLEVIFLGFKYDAILVSNLLLPLHLEKMIRFSNRNVVYNFCDALYTGYDAQYAARDPVRILLNRFGKIWLSRILRTSRHVLVENEQNRQFASHFCPNVSVITGPIDTERYVPRESRKSNFSSIVIGWIGGPSTTPYLGILENAFRNLSQKYSQIVIELIGAAELKVEGVQIVIKKWDYESEVSNLQNFDIGIMPLPDNEWTRGKGGYKLLQYMACGIPCVASPVGVNADIIQDGFNGFLARSEEEWIEKLSLLIESPDLRQKMGENGRIIAEERYSIKANIHRFLNALGLKVSFENKDK